MLVLPLAANVGQADATDGTGPMASRGTEHRPIAEAPSAGTLLALHRALMLDPVRCRFPLGSWLEANYQLEQPAAQFLDVRV